MFYVDCISLISASRIGSSGWWHMDVRLVRKEQLTSALAPVNRCCCECLACRRIIKPNVALAFRPSLECRRRTDIMIVFVLTVCCLSHSLKQTSRAASPVCLPKRRACDRIENHPDEDFSLEIALSAPPKASLGLPGFSQICTR